MNLDPGGSAGPNSGGSAAPAVGVLSHNTYAALVDDYDDLVGHVAYALYKRDKLKFCDTERARTGGVAASSDRIDAFIRGCNIDTRIAAYRAEAETLLQKMTDFVLEDAIRENREEFQEQLIAKLSEAKAWGRAVLEALLGSFGVACLWALLVVLLYAANVGPGKMLHDIFNVDVSKSGVTPAPAPAPR